MVKATIPARAAASARLLKEFLSAINRSASRALTTLSHSFHEVGIGETGRMYLATQSEESTKTHDQRTPAYRIDVWPLRVTSVNQQ
jgi:hypothetical protein